MTVPRPDICHSAFALHTFLGQPDWKEETRAQLRQLLSENGLSWNDLPAVLAEVNTSFATMPLPELLTQRRLAWADMPTVFAAINTTAGKTPRKFAAFRRLHQRWGQFGDANAHLAAEARKKFDASLAEFKLSWTDWTTILIAAVPPVVAAQSPSPPFDPLYDDPRFTPADLVQHVTRKYVWMRDYISVVYSLWICFTHVYQKFSIAPRIALTSEDPFSGKTTALDVARLLVFRPNEEASGTGAAIRDHLVSGPGTILVGEADRLPAKVWEILEDIWDFGHQRGKKFSMMVGGRKVLIPYHCPMIADGIGRFLAPQQDSRGYTLDIERYTEETKPECNFYVSPDLEEFDSVRSYLCRWSARVNLDPDPPMPRGVITRFADNMRGLLSVADSCGWGARAREALMILLEKEKAELPEVVILRHGLVIFDMPGIGNITGPVFDKELRRLDLPGADWNRYSGSQWERNRTPDHSE